MVHTGIQGSDLLDIAENVGVAVLFTSLFVLACTAPEGVSVTGEVATQGSETWIDSESGDGEQLPAPPDLGEDALVCGTVDDYATTSESIALLEGCEKYLGSVVILDSAETSDLSSLASLRVLEGALAGNGLDDPYTISGIEQLEWVGSFSFSDGLSSVSTLESLSGVEEGVQFLGVNNIADFEGFNNLLTIGGGLAITGNASLTTLTGLSSLEWIGDDLYIEGNPELTNLQGLSSLQRVEGDVRIVLNDKLPLSEIDALLAHVDVGGAIHLE
jgi:hypothetical protein